MMVAEQNSSMVCRTIKVLAKLGLTYFAVAMNIMRNWINRNINDTTDVN